MVLFLVDVIKAIVVRVVLGIHSLLAVWRVVAITSDEFYWWLAIVDAGLVLEGLVTIVARKGMEYKWFCPCFLIYLCGTVPAIWLMELDRRDRIIHKKPEDVTQATTTGLYNVSNTSLSSTTPPYRPGSINVAGVSLPVSIELPPDTWVVIIEQLLLYFMIIGRWMLPRGKISRNELSQLLFVFIGMASDITELFALFDEDPVRQSIELTYTILTIWTVSLIQFCFVLTATKSPSRSRVALQTDNHQSRRSCVGCCKTELWSILVSMCMQDLPFLCIRAYSLAKFNLITYSIIFFTAKNILIVLLLLYRISVICFSKKEDDDDDNDNDETEKVQIKVENNRKKTTTTNREGLQRNQRDIKEVSIKNSKNGLQRKRNSPSDPRFNSLSVFQIDDGSGDHRVHNWVTNNKLASKYVHVHMDPQHAHSQYRHTKHPHAQYGHSKHEQTQSRRTQYPYLG